MQKNFLDRQAALRELLQGQSFKNQDEVVKAMKRLGYPVTQPSISRDFRELGVVRVGGRYLAQESIAAEAPSMFSQFAGEISSAGDHLLVLKTAPGAASAVAEEIYTLTIPEIAGTVAGDNTIFIATTGKSAKTKILKALNEI